MCVCISVCVCVCVCVCVSVLVLPYKSPLLVTSIKLYTFIPISVAVVNFQGHSNVGTNESAVSLLFTSVQDGFCVLRKNPYALYPVSEKFP